MIKISLSTSCIAFNSLKKKTIVSRGGDTIGYPYLETIYCYLHGYLFEFC